METSPIDETVADTLVRENAYVLGAGLSYHYQRLNHESEKKLLCPRDVFELERVDRLSL